MAIDGSVFDIPDSIKNARLFAIRFGEGRSNLGVVKKTRAKFSSKKPIHRGTGRKNEIRSFSIVNNAA
jgi:hypothetical protein